VLSLNGSKFTLILKNNYTKLIFLLENKDETPRCIETFLNETKIIEHRVKMLMCDPDTEFVNLKLTIILQKHSMIMRTSMTDGHNDHCNRIENQSVIETARLTVHHKNLPVKL